jgi:hypothetical protein
VAAKTQHQPRHGRRASTQDADRQSRTAGAILRVLADQPRVMLADEVGMGKTYAPPTRPRAALLFPDQARQ